MVMNNEALGMIRHLQRDYFDCLFAGTTDGCGFASCNFAEVAKAYGIPALRMLCDAVREEAPEFLEGRPETSGSYARAWNFCISQDLSG